MKKLSFIPVLTFLGLFFVLALYVGSFDTNENSFPLTLRKFTGESVAFTAWQLPDENVMTVKISQKDYDEFAITRKGVGEPTDKPDPDAKFLMAAGGIAAIDTIDGWPHFGDAYEYNHPDLGKVLAVAITDNIDWSYSGSIAGDPGRGPASLLTGIETSSSGSKIYLKPNEYDLNNLPKIKINNNKTVSIFDNAANVIFTSRPINKISQVKKIIPNHKSVSFDAKSVSTSAGASSLVYQHIIASQSDRYLGVLTSFGPLTSIDISSITYAGVSLTFRLSANSGSRGEALYDLINPTTGTNNIVISFTSAVGGSVSGGISAYGVNQTTPLSNTNTTIGTSTSPSITVTSASDEIVITGLGWISQTISDTLDGTWISDWNNKNSTNNIGGVGAHIAGASSVTRTDTLTSSVAWGMVGASLKAVVTGGGDTTPPILSGGSPTGSLAEGTTQATLSVTTDENATCKYSTTAGTSYASMTNTFSTTGLMSHSTTVTGLTNGTSYNYYVRCQDTAGNPNTADYLITFSVTASDTTPPILSAGSPTGTLSSGTTQTTLSLTSNENATCKYSTTAGTSYASMTNTFSTTGTTSHSTLITGLVDGTSYNYYIRCQDVAGNANTSDFAISFSVASAPSGLVAHWRFDDATGTSAVDSSGNGKTGTLATNGPVWALGNNNWALDFDGVNDVVTIPDNGGFDGSSVTRLTVSAWVNVQTLVANRGLVSKSPGTSFGLIQGSLTNSWRWGVGAGACVIEIPNTVSTGWHMVTATFIGSTECRLYVDAVEIGIDTTGVPAFMPDSTTQVSIGASSSTSSFMDALIDEVRIYNKALSQTEITNLYQGELGTLISSLIPVMDMGAGTYLGFPGSLYENASNSPPSDHNTAGLVRGAAITPRDANGTPSPTGKVVFMSIGISNTTQEWCTQTPQTTQVCSSWTFTGQAQANATVNSTNLAILNGAFDAQTSAKWDQAFGPDPDITTSVNGYNNNYDRVRDTVLAAQGFTEAQVQALWLKAPAVSPYSVPPFIDVANAQETIYGNILRAAKQRYPNLQQVFISTRSYGGYLSPTPSLSPESAPYWTAFPAKWVIQAQIDQMRNGGTMVDTKAGDLNYTNNTAPWVAWGPYLWTNGTTPRSDGLTWQPGDVDTDQVHPSTSGETKVGTLLLDFFLASFYTPWFRVDTTPPILSAGSPTGTLSSGTTQTTLSLTSNENATCKYSTTAGTSYASMTNTFSTTGTTSHSTLITGLVDGTSYNYYIRCQDVAGNANTSDFAISFSVASAIVVAPTWYTAPNGLPTNNGSINSPWDLQTALCGGTSLASNCSGTKAVQPGDTIYLRGGIYSYASATHPSTINPDNGLFTIKISGTASNPIKIQSYPGEWAVIDGKVQQFTFKNTSVVKVLGDYVYLIGFEITNSDLNGRTLSGPPPASPVDGLICAQNSSNRCDRRGNGLDVYGDGDKIINLIVHDTGQGPGLWDQCANCESYGVISYNNGWDDTYVDPVTEIVGGPAGHGYYSNGDSGKTISDNIVFGNYVFGIQLSSSGGFVTNNYRIDGNIIFSDDLWIGNGRANNAVINNYFFTKFGSLLTLNGGGSGTGMSVTDNFIIADPSDTSGPTGVSFDGFSDLQYQRNVSSVFRNLYLLPPGGVNYNSYGVNNNTYYKFSPTWDTDFCVSGPCYTFNQWQTNYSFDANSTYSASLPTTARSFVRLNAYDINRANVAIYNWGGAGSVGVNLPEGWLSTNTCELRAAQNYFNDVVTGQCGSVVGNINMSAAAHTPTSRIGGGPNSNTFPQFGAFVLIRKSPPPGDTIPPVRSNGAPLGTLVSGTTSTTLSLTTNENATCKYSTTAGVAYSSMTNTFTSTTGSTNHSATVTGLINGTSYTYHVRCQDTVPNTNTSDYAINFSVAVAAPVISNIQTSNITENSATITWTTNVPSTSQVNFGLTSNYNLSTVRDLTLVTVHSVTIGNLAGSTLYHYQVVSDANGPSAYSADQTFTTQVSLSIPIISNVQSTYITQTSALITWTTNIAANSQVEYGPTTSYGFQSSLDTNLVTLHSVPLSGLSGGTNYNFRVSSGGTVSVNNNFTTPAPPGGGGDTAPPGNISDLKITGTSFVSVDFSWTAPGDDGNAGIANLYQLRWLPVTITLGNWGEAVPLTGLPAPKMAGSQENFTAIGLSPNTFYHFAIRTLDDASNVSGPSNVVSTKTKLQDPSVVPTGTAGGSGDTAPPGQVKILRVVEADKQVLLEWENPSSVDFARVLIVQSTIEPTSSSLDGTVIFEGEAVSAIATGLTNGRTYYFGISSLDLNRNASLPLIVKAVPKAGVESFEKNINRISEKDIADVIAYEGTPLITASSEIIFKSPLSLGSKNDEVKKLQEFLAKDKEIYPEGIINGSFGPLTQKAVQRFQIKYNIVISGTPQTTGFGRVGPKTLKKLNEVYGITRTSPITETTLPEIIFKSPLSLGSKNDEVKKLQEFLAKDKEIYPEGIINGSFGPLTQKAVQRFQIKYNIVISGTPQTTGFGRVGPKTLKKLNEVYDTGAKNP